MYDVVFEDRAELELYEIIDYYESLNLKSVIEKFTIEYSQIINVLETHPFFELKYENFRTIPFDNFPYLVFFEIFEDLKIVNVVSVIHTSRDPENYPI